MMRQTGLAVEDVKKVTDEVVKELKQLPPAQPERKKGKWIFKNDTKQFFCDQCDEPSLTADDVYIYSMDFSKFCPNCGADMRGEEMSRNERNDSMRQM